MEKPTCYMCDAPSVGKDHVPPKCLFPEERRYRKSLIKVPSCDEHNSGRSKDDQYLRWVLSVTNAHSEVAMRVLNNGASPLFDKKPHLQETFLPDLHFQVSDGGMHKSTFAIDPVRFYNSVTSIARGLYYHHTWHSHKALGPMEINWGVLKGKQVAIQALDLSDQEYETFTSSLPNQPEYTLGENPEVFRYGFDLKSDPEHAVCIMRFYEGHAMFVRWKKDKREYSTKLKSIRDYLEEFGEITSPAPTDLSGDTGTEWMRQLDERNARLAMIMKEAKRQRDFGAFTLVKMLFAEIDEKKALCRGQSASRQTDY